MHAFLVCFIIYCYFCRKKPNKKDMQYILKAPALINADVILPASKSVSNRALIISAIAGGGIIPDNLSDCDDTNVMINALKEMPPVIDIMAAGTAMRFLTAYLSITPGEHVITGTERMRHRPIAIMVDALRYMGADISYEGEEGYPPLRIRGKQLRGGEITLSGSVSSQYISALLMIAPALADGLKIKLEGEIISRPYIDLTIWMMSEFGAKVEWTDIDTITVEPHPYTPHRYFIENDWSAASYMYEMMALSGSRYDNIVLHGLFDGSKQGDSVVRYIFSLLGVKTEFMDADPKTGTTVVRLINTGRCVPKLEYDFVNSPDLAQTFVACCAVMGVPFRFTGLQTLKIKETDRIEALKNEMRKLGYVIHDYKGCELSWDGERCTPDHSLGIDTYEDHRMALAFAPLAFRIDGLKINNPHVVTKSFPHYWEQLTKMGFVIEEIK